jgi:hypothetical protein
VALGIVPGARAVSKQLRSPGGISSKSFDKKAKTVDERKNGHKDVGGGQAASSKISMNDKIVSMNECFASME